jgi:hypothetical protein
LTPSRAGPFIKQTSILNYNSRQPDRESKIVLKKFLEESRTSSLPLISINKTSDLVGPQGNMRWLERRPGGKENTGGRPESVPISSNYLAWIGTIPDQTADNVAESAQTGLLRQSFAESCGVLSRASTRNAYGPFRLFSCGLSRRAMTVPAIFRSLTKSREPWIWIY